MTIQLLRKKFTVEQYHPMMDSGIFTKGDRPRFAGRQLNRIRDTWQFL